MRTLRRSTVILACVAFGACSWFAGEEKPLEPVPLAVPTPRPVRSLSELSDKPVANPFASVPAGARAVTRAEETSDGSERAWLEAPTAVRHVGTDRSPGEQRLLNAKAAQFSTFARDLLDRLFDAAVELEGGDRISRRKLPDDLKPVVITATMNPEGRLEELIIEQHSGQAIVDTLFVDACKKALWYNNPPQDAAGADGKYRMRIEGRLKNFASQGGIWTFTTFLGMAIL
jgi:hypothetical protein